MNPTEAMNFMLQLMDEYKTNQDLLDNMSKVSPREAKYYDNFYIIVYMIYCRPLGPAVFYMSLRVYFVPNILSPASPRPGTM